MLHNLVKYSTGNPSLTTLYLVTVQSYNDIEKIDYDHFSHI